MKEFYIKCIEVDGNHLLEKPETHTHIENDTPLPFLLKFAIKS